MKKIVVVTDFNGDVHLEIERNLREVLDQKVEIEHLFVNSMDHEKPIHGDVVLFMMQDRAEQFKEVVVSTAQVVVASRTIKEDMAFKLLDMPEGSEILLVNDCIENTLETVSLIYRLQITGLKLTPYDTDMDTSRFSVAITPGESRLVPVGIKRIIDVGNRCLDAETMIHLINLLEMNRWEINKKLLKYINSTANLEEGIKVQYRRTSLREAQLRTVVNMAQEGFLLVSKDGVILMHNDFVTKDFGWDVVDGQTALAPFLAGTDLVSKGNFTDELVKINGKWVLVSSEKVKHMTSVDEYMMLFRDVTYIRKLENSVWEKTKAKGQQAVYTFEDIISQSQIMRRCIEKAKRFAGNDLTVMIEGKSGTGKELLAQSIHNESARNMAPFIAVNCAALPKSLLESELFGYEAGSFTGARKEGKRGLFELANRGTIFLDEIGDMPINLQSRLLRVIQEKQIMRIGSDQVIGVDVRVVAATNKNLKKEVEQGRFREDLYYRINVLPLEVPPLNQRKEDILLLFNLFLGEPDFVLPITLRQILIDHEWEGNVRELENVANYFKLMKDTDDPYPAYLLNSVVTVPDHAERNLEEEILLICYRAHAQGQSIGRERLKAELEKSSGTEISEYKIRKLCKQISDKNLMKVHRGRQGCCLTHDGLKVVEDLI
jgi:transcriptional regulator with PAS, ATPase and Fis domain